MSIEPIRRPGLEQVPTEVTDWLQNLFVRLRTQLSTLQCLCMMKQFAIGQLSKQAVAEICACLSFLLRCGKSKKDYTPS